MTTVSGPSGGLFVIFDVEGRHILSSAALHAFTGQAADSIVGATWLQLTHPDDLDYARDFCRRAFGEQCSFAGWWRIRRHDGVFVWAMIGGAALASQLSDAPMAYMIAIDPLSQTDAFPRAGGVIGPERLSEGAESEPQSRLARVERLADMALMASALARETGETAIAHAFDVPLEQIGFQLAQLTEPSPPPARDTVTMSEGYGRPPRQARVARRRLASRG